MVGVVGERSWQVGQQSQTLEVVFVVVVFVVGEVSNVKCQLDGKSATLSCVLIHGLHCIFRVNTRPPASLLCNMPFACPQFGSQVAKLVDGADLRNCQNELKRSDFPGLAWRLVWHGMVRTARVKVGCVGAQEAMIF